MKFTFKVDDVVVYLIDGVVVPVSVEQELQGGGEPTPDLLPGRGHPLAQHRVVHPVPEVNQSKIQTY